MPLVSYAQNAEDVRLARVFGDQPVGRYVDVGAAHPTSDSVTRLFYDRGWRGINVEPNMSFFTLLERDRPGDVNLHCALSDRHGTMTLYARGLLDGGASLLPEVVDARDGDPTHAEAVDVLTLAELVERHHVGDPDFLKIDVEGHEREALLGADFTACRPRVLIIEATRPHTAEPSHAQWEALVLGGGYVFCCFDGINRWYVREEDAGWADDLSRPVTVLDDWVPYTYSHQVDELGEEVATVQEVLADTRAAVVEAERSRADLRRQLSVATEALTRQQALIDGQSAAEGHAPRSRYRETVRALTTPGMRHWIRRIVRST